MSDELKNDGSADDNLHPAIRNLKNNQAKLFARSIDCYIECPEMGPDEDTPYQLHLRPPKGVDFDQYNRFNPVTDSFKYACAYLQSVVVDPVERVPVFTAYDMQALAEAHNPVFIITLANKAMMKLAEVYPNAAQIKNGSTKTGAAT